jgi:hypothetical protein
MIAPEDVVRAYKLVRDVCLLFNLRGGAVEDVGVLARRGPIRIEDVPSKATSRSWKQ